eukprot:TCALIF_01566-PA protein Name:"Similar to Fjx1 Four-jointed box protein 1 (Mus musculus)" AED:0.11 eAED:0.11 QI:0/0.66/0.5/1/0.66/0.5/4/214/472
MIRKMDEARLYKSGTIKSSCSAESSELDQDFFPHFHSHQKHSTTLSIRRKLLLLLFIASLALLSIVVISEQLISRYMDRQQSQSHLRTSSHGDAPPVIEIDIYTLERWAQEAKRHKDDKIPLEDIRKSAKQAFMDLSGINLVEDGIFWSGALEARVPHGPSDQQVQDQLQAMRSRQVEEILDADFSHCGREQNRRILFQDGTEACARNREDHVEFVQGEVMAFYLARLLGITNTPPVALSSVNGSAWDGVRQGATNWTQTNTNKIVALIQWIPELTKVVIPPALREALDTKEALDIYKGEKFQDLDEEEMGELVQWSDLIIFDFLTGNYDRVATMQDAASKLKRPGLMKETVRNLAKSTRTGSLWMIDNESAFLAGYGVIHLQKDRKMSLYLEDLLKANCIFRRTTVQRLFALHKSAKPAELLIHLTQQNEPLFQELPTIHENSIFVQHFAERLEQVWQWVQHCQSRLDFIG